MAGNLSLKWGTLKGWSNLDEESVAVLEKFYGLGVSMSAMTQSMTPAHIEAICELIDAVDEPIRNDWTGDDMTREEAKEYVQEYHR